MRLFAIGDLHLSLGVPEKPMDIFRGWENYQTLLEENWRSTISEEDTVVLAGDSSWGMSLEEALPDFRLIDSLPGTKIILKGNHDYWWNSMAKMTAFFEANGLSTLHILHNNSDSFGDFGICGTRGWVNTGLEEPQNAKVIASEAQRLTVSIEHALAAGKKPIVFLHYPPMFASAYNYEILDVLYKYRIERCYYGHIHGSGAKKAITGERDGILFRMISSDYLEFQPELVI